MSEMAADKQDDKPAKPEDRFLRFMRGIVAVRKDELVSKPRKKVRRRKSIKKTPSSE